MTKHQHTPFRIALTADFYDEADTPRYSDFGLDTFDGHDHIVVSKFSEHHGEITPDQLAECQAALVLTPSPATLLSTYQVPVPAGRAIPIVTVPMSHSPVLTSVAL